MKTVTTTIATLLLTIAATGCEYLYEQGCDEPCFGWDCSDPCDDWDCFDPCDDWDCDDPCDGWDCGDDDWMSDAGTTDDGGTVPDVLDDPTDDGITEDAADDVIVGDATADVPEETTDPGPDSLPCEPRCEYDVFTGMALCAEAFGECKLGCEGPWAYECLYACGEAFESCAELLQDEVDELCRPTCPCSASLVDCMEVCGSDTVCINGCISDFEDCQGYDWWIQGECEVTCVNTETECMDLCHIEYGYCDWVSLIDCEHTCQSSSFECSAECYISALR